MGTRLSFNGSFIGDDDAPVFAGPIANQTWPIDEAITPITLADYFDPDGDSYTEIGSSLPDGVTLAAGVISGTPTAIGSYPGLQYRAVHTDGDTDTNIFSAIVTGPDMAIEWLIPPPNIRR